jgi:Tol biopolymer transport system component/class 3 adenylate cyclase
MPESSLENEGPSQRPGSLGPKAPVTVSTDQIIMAHVLFIDLVGYSLLKTDKGSLLVQEVFQIVSDTVEFRRAKAAGELILLPSGDGTAVVFLRDLSAPVRCAEEIARAVSKRPEIKLRMGVNTGPVSWIVDINGSRIVAGAAINYAQRAMDCGDAGHILLTNSTAEYLMKVTEWANGIHELGTYEIKHQEVVRLFNFYTAEVGNPKRTSRRSIKDPREEAIFGRISAKFRGLPRAVSLSSGILILAAVAYWLLPPSTTGQHRGPNGPRVLLANLTPGGAIGISYPQFSPDGQWLAYASKSSGKWDVYLQSFDNGQLAGSPRNLTQQLRGDSTEPAFTRDSKKIAFSSEAGPSFSPEGKLLDLGSDEQSEGIFVANVWSGDVEKVAPRGFNPVWSRDGMKILYASENIVRPEDRTTVKSKLSFVDMVSRQPTTLFLGDAVQPSWSPNGRRVAFWFVKNGVRDIATIPAGGGPVVPITNDPPMDWNPVWSRDGYVYFSSDRGGDGFQLWRIWVDEDSGRSKGNVEPVKVVVDGPRERPVEVGHITISQDGSWVAAIDRHYAAHLCKIRFDSVTATCNAAIENVRVSDRPSTRPDLDSNGDWLVFNQPDGIFVLGADGFHPSLLVNDAFQNRSPRWAPDGGRVAFFSNRTGNFEIWVGERGAELGLKQLTKSTGSIYPVWSPKGNQVAYTSWGPDLEQRTVVSNVFDPKPVRQEKPPPEFDGSFIAWSWSPKGDKLAGYRQRPDGKFTGIFVHEVNKPQYTKLTSFGSDPIWLNDNHRLLFHYKGKIYVVDSALPEAEREKKVRLVLSVAPHDVARRGFSISADNKWIYFSREEIGNRLWIGTMENSEYQSSNYSRIVSWFNRNRD